MKYQYWYASCEGISGKKKIGLLEHFGDERILFEASEKEIADLHILSQKALEKFERHRKNREWEAEYEQMLREEIRIVSWKNGNYPKRLREIYDPPYALFVKGELPKEGQKNVAIVGARSCSAYGQAMAQEISRQLAVCGVGVISGLAYGIDAAAHQGALKGEGKTYAVMGCGVNVCYPCENISLYEDIVKRGGILSEYGMGVSPQKYHFPMRNRLISALADVILVVEARKRSGSLITADTALEQGKNVYAVPGRICDELSYGTNWLIHQGASVFYSMKEFLKDMGMDTNVEVISKKIMENGLEKKEKLLYSVLDFSPKHIDTIIEETGMLLSETASILSVLVQKKIVKEIYKNYYVKVTVR